eukprot:TRINITY_DN20360_c0_g1_i1.p1 TRINITY_DN20360_c0_g1~~TRINITY_DN20360_c0_g1_i1.p1  ORF type:complete len:571 (+),score=33.12 TRINITY_DN20360_c0_g1_i1:127-1713(+)
MHMDVLKKATAETGEATTSKDKEKVIRRHSAAPTAGATTAIDRSASNEKKQQALMRNNIMALPENKIQQMFRSTTPTATSTPRASELTTVARHHNRQMESLLEGSTHPPSATPPPGALSGTSSGRTTPNADRGSNYKMPESILQLHFDSPTQRTATQIAWLCDKLEEKLGRADTISNSTLQIGHRVSLGYRASQCTKPVIRIFQWIRMTPEVLRELEICKVHLPDGSQYDVQNATTPVISPPVAVQSTTPTTPTSVMTQRRGSMSTTPTPGATPLTGTRYSSSTARPVSPHVTASTQHGYLGVGNNTGSTSKPQQHTGVGVVVGSDFSSISHSSVSLTGYTPQTGPTHMSTTPVASTRKLRSISPHQAYPEDHSQHVVPVGSLGIHKQYTPTTPLPLQPNDHLHAHSHTVHGGGSPYHHRPSATSLGLPTETTNPHRRSSTPRGPLFEARPLKDANDWAAWNDVNNSSTNTGGGTVPRAHEGVSQPPLQPRVASPQPAYPLHTEDLYQRKMSTPTGRSTSPSVGHLWR